MPVSIKGSGGGSVTLDAGAAATDTTLTLPNTSGTVALTASPTFSGTLTATTVTSPASTALTIQSAGTTAMTVSTAQNVGIGTSSPDYLLTLQSTDAAISIKDSGGTTRAYIGVSGTFGSAPTGALRLRSEQGGLVYGYAGTEQMRIDTSGNLLVGTTTADSRITVKGADSTSSNFSIYARNSSNTALMTVRNDGAGYLLASAWNYGSDRSLKENIYYITPAECLEKILQAKPVKYDFISGAKDNYGYIAQDVQEWLPEAVSETENGTLGLKSDFIDAMGTGAIQALHMMIQELSAKNDALEARLAALEAK